MIARQPRATTVPMLHLVSDPRVPRARLLDVIGDAVDAGVDAVHVRDASLSARDLFALTTSIRDVVRGRARLFVNDRLDVALAAGADGVQLPAHGIPAHAARTVAGTSFLIGVSTHTLNEAHCAEASHADFVLFGSVYTTSSHPGPSGLGVETLREVANAVRIPVIAIGGITADRVGPVVRAGAGGVAVISAVFGASNAASAAASLTAALNEEHRRHERSNG